MEWRYLARLLETGSAKEPRCNLEQPFRNLSGRQLSPLEKEVFTLAELQGPCQC